MADDVAAAVAADASVAAAAAAADASCCDQYHPAPQCHADSSFTTNTLDPALNQGKMIQSTVICVNTFLFLAYCYTLKAALWCL